MQQLIEELRSRAQVDWKLGADALQQHSRALSITSAVAGTAFVLWVLLYATVMYLQEVKSMGKVTVLKVSTHAITQLCMARARLSLQSYVLYCEALLNMMIAINSTKLHTIHNLWRAC
jgi:hypothetical protein